MSITFACENCGKPFTVDAKLAGKKGRCKRCGAVMPIPFSGDPPIPSSSTRLDDSARGDLYGLDDPPPPPRGGLPPGIEEIGPGPTGDRKPVSRQALLFPRSRPAAAKGGNLVVRIVVGIALGLISLAGGGAAILSLAGINDRGSLEAIIQERVALNQQLAALLAGVTDFESARATSPSAVGKIKAVAANLRKLKKTKGLKTDVEALKGRYQAPQIQAEQQVIGHLTRIMADPEAWGALAVQGSLEELAREEESIPGRPRMVTPAIQAPPPIVGPTPLINRGPAMPRSTPGPEPIPKPGRARTNRKSTNRPDSVGPR